MADEMYVRYEGAWVPLTQIHLIGGSDYHPVIWNDDGVYDRFYINFKAPLQPFSISKFNECVIVYGGSRLMPTKIAKTANPNVYEVTIGIASESHGLVVSNIKAGLVLSTGENLPFFSEFFYVSGLPEMLTILPIYDPIDFSVSRFGFSISEAQVIEFAGQDELNPIYEAIGTWPALPLTDTVTVTLS